LSLALFDLDTLDERACDAYNLEHANAGIAVFSGARPQELSAAAGAHVVDPRKDAREQAGTLAKALPRAGQANQGRTLAVCGALPQAERGAALAQQDQAEWAWAFLHELQQRAAIKTVLCAGRPGWEIGFVAAALALGVGVEATLPRHFSQRGISRVSTPRLPWQLQGEIEHWARLLRLLEGG
jgi:hypothetical protein